MGIQSTGQPGRDHEWSTGTIQVPGGDLCYRTIGGGPLIVAVHGIQGTSAAWQDVARLLSGRSTFVAPDMRGRAPSLVPDDSDAYALSRFAGDLEALIAEVGRPVVLVGWSMGVFILLEYLHSGGPEPAALVLTGGSAHLGSTKWFHGPTFQDVEQQARTRATKLGLRRTAEPRAVAASWFQVESSDYRDLLPRITAPTLVLHGGNDEECPPPHAELLAERIPRAELEIWPQAGHNLMAHDPSRFASAVSAFLDAQRIPDTP